jgi:hypothetical protein
MSHEVNPDNEHLEFSHSKIMKAIYGVISHNSPFIYKENARALGLDCVTIAKEVHGILSTYMSSVDGMVKGKKAELDTFGVFPIKDQKLAESVEQIYTKLLEHLDNLPPALLARLLKSSAQMDNQNRDNIFSIINQYPPFQSKGGALQPLFTGDNKSGEKLFRAHLCKVQMKAGGKMQDDLQQAISNHYDSLVRASDEIEDKEEALSEINQQLKKLFDDDENFAIIGLRDLLDKETSGLIRREVGIAYLEYLLENAKKQSCQTAALEKIINNIRQVEDYIHDPSRSNTDCMYQVTDEHACDLRELLGNADAFTNLPVIGLVDGSLEERSSQEERVFVFGIRFKANNPVTTPDRDFPELKSGMSVYARHLAKAIKVLELAKQFNTARGGEKTDYKKLRLLGRSIKTVFLYYMIFSDHPEKLNWWQQTAIGLHNRDPNALDRLLALANTMLKAEEKATKETIAPAIVTLKAVLSNKSVASFTGKRRCHVLLGKQLVNDDIYDAAEGDIFIKDLHKSARQDMNPLKKCLRYVHIVKETQNVLPAALYSISFDLSFYDSFFYADRKQKRAINVSTQPQAWHFLPVLVQPQITKANDIYHKPLTQTAGLMVQIMPDIKPDKSNTFEFFVYKVTAAVVFLLGLSALCQKLSAQQINLAIPLLRLHKGDETDIIEEYLHSVCAAVTFLLNEKYTMGTQGIQLLNLNATQQKSLRYKITNARSSLYAFLPKTFTASGFAPAFGKLAIVIVTQRVAGKRRYENKDDFRLVNLFGRVVMLERLDEQTLQLSQNFLTFADNFYKHEIETYPKILIDTIHRLYDKEGVRDVLYIAKTPFTSNLNLTHSQKALYFLSESVLQQMMQNRADLNIYPAFCDKYPARMFGGAKLNAVYIDDVPSIQKHVQMDRASESQIVTFLNIANGIKVKGKDAEKNFFNNIMSYATLDNLYTDRTLQSRILDRLIAPNTAPRQTLIDFICLLHAAAYEKVEGSELALKLNPYQDILEDDNVNRLNTFPAFPNNGKPDFNLFAFMTKIQRVIYRLDEEEYNET